MCMGAYGCMKNACEYIRMHTEAYGCIWMHDRYQVLGTSYQVLGTRHKVLVRYTLDILYNTCCTYGILYMLYLLYVPYNVHTVRALHTVHTSQYMLFTLYILYGVLLEC